MEEVLRMEQREEAERETRTRELLPKRWHRRRPFQPEDLPRAYLTPKGKCMSPSGGLSCTRQHAHEREIIGNSRDPLRKVLGKAARALRLARMLSGLPSWTLWNQSRLVIDINKQFYRLKVCPE